MNRRLLWRLLLYPLLCLPLLLVALVATAPGTRLVIHTLGSQVPGLTLRHGEGSVLRGLRLEALAWEQDALSVAGADLVLPLHLPCLWRSEVCLEQAQLQRLEVSWSGGSVRADALQLQSLEFDGDALSLSGLVARRPVLAVMPGQDAPENAPSAQDSALPAVALPFTLALEGTRLIEPEVRLADTVYRADLLLLSADWQAHAVSLHSLQLDAPPGRLSLGGELALQGEWPLAIELEAQPDALWLQDRGMPPEVALQAPLAAQLTGSVADLGVHLETRVTGLQRDTVIPLALDAQLSPQQGGTIRVAVDGPEAPQLLSVQAELTWSSGVQALLDLDWDGLELPAWILGDLPFGAVSGGAAVALDLDQGDGLDVRLERSAVQTTVLEQALSLTGTAHYRGGDTTLPVLAIAGDFAGTSFTLERPPGGELALAARGDLTLPQYPVDLRQLALDARLDAALERLRLDLSAQRLVLAGQQIESLSVEAAAERSQQTLDLSWRQPWPGAIAPLAEADTGQPGYSEGRLKLAGSWSEPVLSLLIEQADLATPLGVLRLEEAAILALDTAAATAGVPAHCWRMRQLSACLPAAQLGADGQWSVALSGPLQLSPAETGLPATLDLRVEGRLDLRWLDAGLQELRADLALAPLSLAPAGDAQQSVPDLTIDTLDVQLRWQPEALDIDASLAAASAGALKVSLQGRGASPLRGRLEVPQLELAPFAPLAPALTELRGTLSGGLDLDLAARSVISGGSLRLDQGYLQAAQASTAIEALHGELRVEGDTVRYQLDGRLGGGPLQLNGALDPQGERLLASLRGERNRLELPERLEAVLSPALNLRVEQGTAALQGSVRVHEGRVRQTQAPANAVTVSEDTVLLNAEAPSSGADSTLLAMLGMDLKLEVAERFRVQAAGIDATVGGDLRLLRQPGEPLQLFGNVAVVGGELQAYGQRLIIERGDMGFVGAPDNPQLALRAERNFPRDAVRVGVLVEGTLQEPQLNLYSEPAMPQQDTLSWLLRGRGPDAGAELDGTALALSLGTSAINRSGVVDSLNALPLLSNISFGMESGEGGAAATVSGYVGERIYLSYGMGLYEPINTLTARFYLQTRLWLEIVSRLNNSVDLYYRFDID